MPELISIPEVGSFYNPLDGRIHDVTFQLHAGGVGRNITDALGKLGYRPTFLSVVGKDSHGQYLCNLLPKSSIQHVQRLSDYNTAQCTILLDSHGDCKLLVGDMGIHQQISPEIITSHEEIIKNAPLLVLDANLSLPALDAALELAEKYNIPVFFEPTDVPIAGKPFQSTYWKAIRYITPNLQELKEISKTLKIALPIKSWSNEIEEAATIAKLVADYVPNIILTLGKNGLLMIRRGEACEPLFGNQNAATSIKIRHYPAEICTNLINVSGAGDCLASGLIAAMLKGLNEEQCVKVGFEAARGALLSQSAVPQLLFNDSHQCWNTQANYRSLI